MERGMRQKRTFNPLSRVHEHAGSRARCVGQRREGW